MEQLRPFHMSDDGFAISLKSLKHQYFQWNEIEVEKYGEDFSRHRIHYRLESRREG